MHRRQIETVSCLSLLLVITFENSSSANAVVCHHIITYRQEKRAVFFVTLGCATSHIRSGFCVRYIFGIIYLTSLRNILTIALYPVRKDRTRKRFESWILERSLEQNRPTFPNPTKPIRLFLLLLLCKCVRILSMRSVIMCTQIFFQFLKRNVHFRS